MGDSVLRLDRLLSSEAQVIHRTRRRLFEKRIVTLGERTHVLYRLPLPWQARRLAHLLREAQARGVAMQRVECVAARWLDLARYGGCWLVAGYEAGETLKIARFDDALVDSLAASLARLHSISARGHGPLLRLGARVRSLMNAVEGDVHLALAQCEALAPQEQEAMRTWLGGRGERVWCREGFDLTHGDLLAKNILIRADGAGVCLIDYELAAFDRAGFEVAAALIRFFHGRNTRYRARFLERYLAECSATVREDWQAHAPYFLVAAALRMARSRERRRHALSSRGEQEAAGVQARRFDAYVKTAFSLMQAFEQGATDPEAMLAAGGR